MVLGGVVFSLLNVVTQWLTMTLAFPAASAAFWQYGFAFLFSLPFLRKVGLSAMRTDYPWRHIVRVVLAALGVEAWVSGLASVPIWQAIALVMTSPFFIILGARLFLGERVGPARWMATGVGFIGAMIILQPWSDSFTWAALLPVISALLWGASSLITKSLTGIEKPETITVWLLVLLTPINGGLALAAGFVVPTGAALALFLLAGLLTVVAQYSADARLCQRRRCLCAAFRRPEAAAERARRLAFLRLCAGWLSVARRCAHPRRVALHHAQRDASRTAGGLTQTVQNVAGCHVSVMAVPQKTSVRFFRHWGIFNDILFAQGSARCRAFCIRCLPGSG